MNRREVIALLGGAIVLWLDGSRRAVHAQAPRTPRLGILVLGNPDPGPFLAAFREGLRERGYIEGQTIALELLSADGDTTRLPQAAEELVRLNVDIIVTWQTPAATAAKNATGTIPIVMAGAGDPVGTGLVESLARPGGNVTGLSGFTAELGGKTLDLVRELMPAARRVGVLLNGPDPFSKPLREQIEIAAGRTGLAVHFVTTSRSADLEAAVAELARERADVVLMQPSLPHRRTVDAVSRHRLPVVSPSTGVAKAGGVLAYNASGAAIHRESADYVDAILKGAKPGDLPVRGPKIFELVINLRAAKALGIEVPPALLARADEVIE